MAKQQIAPEAPIMMLFNEGSIVETLRCAELSVRAKYGGHCWYGVVVLNDVLFPPEILGDSPGRYELCKMNKIDDTLVAK